MKMKVLETRHVHERIMLMAWSPRMDLLAVVNAHGGVSLHRLSWQKVWSLSSNDAKGTDGRRGRDPEPPILLLWHPEGLSLAVGFESCTVIIDVESGEITHYHDVKNLSSGRWSPTLHEPSVKDLAARSKHEAIQPDFKFNRVESNLSVLLLGTNAGEIHVYVAGGVLLALILDLKSVHPCNILKSEITPDFKSFQILTHNRIEARNGNVLSVVHLQSELIPSVAEVFGAFGFKIEFTRSLWQSITDEMLALNENWGKIVDVYTHYLTYGSGKENENVRADYVDLLVCGTRSIEMEIFLGSYGREKEAKKFGIAFHASKMNLNENLKNIKRAIVLMLAELNELDGFYELVSQKSDACARVKELSRMYTYLYLACIKFQQIADRFVKIFFNFMTLILVTIHTYNVMETPEPDALDDDTDPDKVFELLRYPVKKNIYDMIYAHDKSSEETIPTIPTVAEYADIENVVDIRSKTTQEDLAWVPFWRHILENPSIDWNDGSSGMFKDELDELLKTFSSNAFEKLNALYSIPLLNSDLEKNTYVLNCFEGEHLGQVGMFFDSDTAMNYVFHQEANETGTLWFYAFEFISTDDPLLTTARLVFSRGVQAYHFFSAKYLSVLSYDRQDKRRDQEHGRSIICQLSIEHMVEKGYQRQLRILRGSRLEAKKWNDLEVSIPADILVPSRVTSPFIDHVMPIDDFNPHTLVVSGARKVGCVLSTSNKTIVLLEMELESPDNTLNSTREDDSHNNSSSVYVEESEFE